MNLQACSLKNIYVLDFIAVFCVIISIIFGVNKVFDVLNIRINFGIKNRVVQL